MNKELIKGIGCVVAGLVLFSGGIGLGFVLGNYSQTTTTVSAKQTENMTIQEMMSAMYRDDPMTAIEHAYSADGQPDIINSDYEAYLNTIVKMEQMRQALNKGIPFKDVEIKWE